MFAKPSVLSLLTKTSTALVVVPSGIGPIALLTQFVASKSVLFGTIKPNSSSVAPLIVITFNPVGVGVFVGGRGVLVSVTVGMKVGVGEKDVTVGVEVSVGSCVPVSCMARAGATWFSIPSLKNCPLYRMPEIHSMRKIRRGVDNLSRGKQISNNF